MAIKEISVQELQQRLDRNDKVFLLDVRQPEEFAISHIAGAVLIPLGELGQRLSELDKQADIIINCKAGGRSARACELMSGEGFASVTNLIGGNDAWQRYLAAR